jgi:hypothetical protein
MALGYLLWKVPPKAWHAEHQPLWFVYEMSPKDSVLKVWPPAGGATLENGRNVRWWGLGGGW